MQSATAIMEAESLSLAAAQMLLIKLSGRPTESACDSNKHSTIFERREHLTITRVALEDMGVMLESLV